MNWLSNFAESLDFLSGQLISLGRGHAREQFQIEVQKFRSKIYPSLFLIVVSMLSFEL